MSTRRTRAGRPAIPKENKVQKKSITEIVGEYSKCTSPAQSPVDNLTTEEKEELISAALHRESSSQSADSDQDMENMPPSSDMSTEED